jgi:chorismate-pyruvate lyase
MTSLQKAKRMLEIAHENYRVQPDTKRWQKFNAALKDYVKILAGQERWKRVVQRV